MGAALWACGGLAAFLVARIVPAGRPRRFVTELTTALITALILGITATALDFGGWKEAEWRAPLLILFGALSAIGGGRALAMRTR
jgi:hypothetical protein